LEFRKVLAFGRGVTLPAVLTQQLGPQLVEQTFKGLSVAQSLLQLRHQLGWDIHAPAAALVGEREDESRVFVAAGAGGTVGANAGLTDFSQGALYGRPELFELAEEILAER